MPNSLTSEPGAANADDLVNPAAHFLDEWIDSHIDEAIVIAPSADPAAQLAQQCIHDAAAQGIDAEQIEGEVGNLEEYIAEVLVEEHPGVELPAALPALSRRR